MTKKIHSLELYDVKIVELDNGEFAEVKDNKKRYPLFLTNKSLQYGRDKGFIETSLIEDMLKILHSQQKPDMTNDEKNIEAIRSLNEEKAIKVIYLGYRGASPQNAMEFEDFLDKYHLDFTETIQLYAELVTSTIREGKNNFATGLDKFTEVPKAGEKK